MSVPESVAAIVLCGGRSVRMGRDKAQLSVGEEQFLPRICRVVAPLLKPLVVVAADGQALPSLDSSATVVRDTLPDAGPLAGLLAGLESLQRESPQTSHFWLAGCDAPFVNTAVISRLLQVSGESQAVLIRHEGHIQPFGGIYRCDVLPAVRTLITSGERRLSQLPISLSCDIVDAATLQDLDSELAFLRNINTPDDYQRFVTDAGQ